MMNIINLKNIGNIENTGAPLMSAKKSLVTDPVFLPRKIMSRMEAAGFHSLFLRVGQISSGVFWGTIAAIVVILGFGMEGAPTVSALSVILSSAMVMLLLGCYTDLAAMRVPHDLIRSFSRLAYAKIIILAVASVGVPLTIAPFAYGPTPLGVIDGLDVFLHGMPVPGALMNYFSMSIDTILGIALGAAFWFAMRLRAGLAAGDRLLIIPAMPLLGVDLGITFILASAIFGGIFALFLVGLRPVLRRMISEGKIKANYGRLHRMAIMNTFPFLPPLAMGFCFAVWPQVWLAVFYVS